MTLDTNTATHLKRHNAAIYAIKELIQTQQLDNTEFITDTLLGAYFGIANIVEQIEQQERENMIRRAENYEQ